MNNVTLRLLQCCADKEPNFSEIKQLIAKGADINEQGNEYRTPLMFACDNNNNELAELLIEKGANVNIQDNNGETALMYSVFNHNKKLVKLLLKKGASLNVISKLGDNILTKIPVGWKKTLAITKLLVDAGADVNHIGKNNRTFLFDICCRSSKSDNLELANFLVAKGADVNAVDRDNYSILRWIANDSGKIEYIKFLLKSGIDVNKQDEKGQTVLIMTSQLLNIPVVKLLLEYDADVFLKTKTGQSALEIVQHYLKYYKTGRNNTAVFPCETIISLLEEAEKIQKLNKATISLDNNFSI